MGATPTPEVAVGAVALDSGRLLLVRRGHGPAAGEWSVPGGRVRFGEALHEAVVREVFEETGLECVVRGFLGWVERIDSASHFVVLDFRVDMLEPGRAPRAGDDAAEATWWPLEALDELALVAGLVDFLEEVGVLEA